MTATVCAPPPPAAVATPEPLAWACTPRLALREFVPRDATDLVAMHRLSRLRTHLVDDYPLHLPAVARLFIERLGAIYRRHEGLGIWHASALQPEPSFAGFFSLMPIPDDPSRIEIGSRLLPHTWGTGLALEGGECMLDHAFDDLGRDEVWGICDPRNRSARAVLAGLGFAEDGLRPYDGIEAMWHRISLNAWRAVRNLPRGTRLRRALRSQAMSAAVPDTTEEPIDAPADAAARDSR